MRPFDIDAAKRGEEVCLRDGSMARIVCFDMKDRHGFTVLAVYEDRDGFEHPLKATDEGLYTHDSQGEAFDLMMVNDTPVGIPEPKVCEFQPFDKVLTRDADDCKWHPSFFGSITRYNDGSILYCTIDGSFYSQCVPYEGNEDLAFTDKNPKI